MKKNACVILILMVVMLISSGCAQKEKEIEPLAVELEEVIPMKYEQTFSEAQLKEDFEALTMLIQNVHPKLYTDQSILAVNISNAEAAIKDQMTELEFFRAIAPMISSLNCGHSWLSLSKESSNQMSLEGSFFPLSLKWIDNKAYVYDHQGAPEIPLSAEIIRINGKETSDIKMELFNYFTADGQNETHKMFLLNIAFNYYYKAVVDDSAAFEIEYITEESKVEKKVVRGISNADLERLYGSFGVDEVLYKSEIKEAYAILTIKSFYMPQALALDEYKDFLASFFKEIKEKHIEHLVLDLRDNTGGDPYFTSELFRYLAKKEQPYFDESASNYYTGLKSNIALAEDRFEGDLFTLINGGSFSSTGHLIALLKYQDIGVFIGEESGASFACTDGTRTHTLSNTKLQFGCSTMIWAVETEGLTPGRGIMPDYPVSMTIEDYQNHKDTVMDFTISLIGD